MYNTKNYTEQGGEATHIGGKLIIEDGADISSLLDAIQSMGRAAVVDRSGTVLEKNVSDLIGEDVKMLMGGAVVGTFLYVTGFEAFSQNEPAEQEGWYFPFRLSDEYKDKPITVKRENGEGGVEKTAADTVYSIKTEGTPILTLSFKNADCLPKKEE